MFIAVDTSHGVTPLASICFNDVIIGSWLKSDIIVDKYLAFRVTVTG